MVKRLAAGAERDWSVTAGEKEGEGRTVCIDFSSVNIAKPFHIGHLSTTVIGAALYRIFAYLGYKPVGINHLGDWGTQFGKLIVAVKKWSDIEEVRKRDEYYLNSLYVRYHKEAENDPSLDDEARAWFKRIEDGDREATEYFSVFKEVTMRAVGKIYDRLGVKFDSYAGESFYNDKMQPCLDILKEKGLLTESDGAEVVRLDEWDMPPCLLVKADGATLYATRDIAAAYYRAKIYDFYKCLYVVAYQQNLHFKQLFKVLELMGFEKGRGYGTHRVRHGVAGRRLHVHKERQGGMARRGAGQGGGKGEADHRGEEPPISPIRTPSPRAWAWERWCFPRFGTTASRTSFSHSTRCSTSTARPRPMCSILMRGAPAH